MILFIARYAKILNRKSLINLPVRIFDWCTVQPVWFDKLQCFLATGAYFERFGLLYVKISDSMIPPPMVVFVCCLHKSSCFHPIVRDELWHIVSDSVRQYNNTFLPFFQILSCDECSSDGTAAAGSRKNAFLANQTSNQGKCHFIVCFDPAINHLTMQNIWYEIITDSFHLQTVKFIGTPPRKSW